MTPEHDSSTSDAMTPQTNYSMSVAIMSANCFRSRPRGACIASRPRGFVRRLTVDRCMPHGAGLN